MSGKKTKTWIIGAIAVIVMLCVGCLTLAGLAYSYGRTWQNATAAPTLTPTPIAVPPTAMPGDPLIPSLTALGFSSREELISFFKMEGVELREIATCPGEVNCVRILREKDENGFIKPFKMTNPTSVTFDGWRAAGQTGGQAKVPPGTWLVEGITLRPWR